jgi:DNA modification methylase
MSKNRSSIAKESIDVTTINEVERKSIVEESKKLGFESVIEYFQYLHRTNLHKGAKKDIHVKFKDNDTPHLYHKTKLGKLFLGDSSRLMNVDLPKESVDLIVTSPPFGLVRKKNYGNEDADSYVDWFHEFALGFKRVLKPKGSLVIDIGGAWKKGYPERSLYHFELLIALCRDHGFHLAQDFYWYNPAKLPTPAEWVTVRRVRVKDAINCVWWLSRTPFPRANNRRVLQPYSKSMETLLRNGYKAKLRPSGHVISDKFNKRNKGAIPSNLLVLANTESNSSYQRYCREHKVSEHPARFPLGIPAFFIRMLTEKNEVVLDPFAGSCVSGEVAQRMGRKWICCEIEERYLEGALERFSEEKDLEDAAMIGRNGAYQIQAPCLNLMEEEESLMVEDGGAVRAK